MSTSFGDDLRQLASFLDGQSRVERSADLDGNRASRERNLCRGFLQGLSAAFDRSNLHMRSLVLAFPDLFRWQHGYLNGI